MLKSHVAAHDVFNGLVSGAERWRNRLGRIHSNNVLAVFEDFQTASVL